jgi:hypothetical protein
MSVSESDGLKLPGSAEGDMDLLEKRPDDGDMYRE